MKRLGCIEKFQSQLFLNNTYYAGISQVVKNPPANAGDERDLGQEDPLEKEMATHSSILAWEIPWTEEPGGLQFMES